MSGARRPSGQSRRCGCWPHRLTPTNPHALRAGPSTIAANYPVTLPPRRSCNLNLTSGDVIATDEVLGQGAWGDVCKGLYDVRRRGGGAEVSGLVGRSRGGARQA